MSTEMLSEVEVQARHLCELLKEYAGKTAALVAGSPTAWAALGSNDLDAVAWWLEQADRLRRPLHQVISRSSQLLEHAELEPLLGDELALRLAEIEVHYHYLIRRYNEWAEAMKRDKSLKPRLAPHRMLAGLPGE